MVDRPDVPPRIAPPLTDETRPFWTGGADGALRITYCATCQRWFHPPVGSCPDCGRVVTSEAVSGRGSVFSFTVNQHQFHPDVPPPYVIAVVELEEQVGLRITTNVVNCDSDDVHIGMRVRVVFEPVEAAWVPVFEPQS